MTLSTEQLPMKILGILAVCSFVGCTADAVGGAVGDPVGGDAVGGDANAVGASDGFDAQGPDASSLDGPGGDAGSIDSGSDAGVKPPPPCGKGPNPQAHTLTADVTYPADHLTASTIRHPFGDLCLPVTAPGQAFYVESKVIRGNCNDYDACEASLELKCFDAKGSLVHPQLWAGENFLNGAPDSAIFARLMFRSTSATPVVCRSEFFHHDHGIAGGTITVRAGSTFTASEALTDVAVTPDSGGATRLSSVRPAATMKPIAGWHMPAGHSSVDYLGDIQVTECHTPYPTGASDPNTQCTTAEPGPNTVVEYWAQAYEEHADGTTCHVTDGVKTTKTIEPRVHHKMLYTGLVNAPHTPGCANVWHFHVYTQWKGGRSFMIQSGPYGQGMVRPR